MSGPSESAPACDSTTIFTFRGNGNFTLVPNLRYQHRLDSGPWSELSTSTTATLDGLSDGSHTFEVAAVDETGNVDPTPPARTFIVDATAASVITNLRPTAVTATTARIQWNTNKPASAVVDYRVVGAAE